MITRAVTAARAAGEPVIVGQPAATCPCCRRQGCRLREEFTQATRITPMTSLGWYGYCPDCAVSFREVDPADHDGNAEFPREIL